MGPSTGELSGLVHLNEPFHGQNQHWTIQIDDWTTEPDKPSGFLQTSQTLIVTNIC